MLFQLFGSSTKAPLLLKFRSSKTFICVTVCTAIFTDIFVYGIVVPVLPFALNNRVKIDPAKIQEWISILLAVYGAALLCAAPICGWLADKFNSRYWPLMFGLLALGASTAMLCVGNSIAIFMAGRILQGLSAAIVWVVGLALLVDTVGPDDVGQTMGYAGLSMSLAMLVAPLLGGVVFENAGYYAVFAMSFGLMILDIFLRIILIEKKDAARWIPQEAPEAKKHGAAPGALQSPTDIEMVDGAGDERPATGHSQQRGQTFEDPQHIGPIEPSRSLAEQELPENTPEPIKRWSERIPPVIFLLKSRRLLSALWGSTMQATLLSAFDSTLPLFVRNTFHWSSTGAGLIFLPIVVMSFLGPIIGHLTDKHGPRWYAIAGYVCACPCLILLRLVHKNTIGQKVLLCALLALVGFCLSLVLTPMMAEITYAVDAKARRHHPGYFGKGGAYAQAYSLFNMAFATGCLLGPLLAGLINQAHGWGTATLILGLISLFTAIPTAIWTGGSVFKIMRRKKELRRGSSSVNATSA